MNRSFRNKAQRPPAAVALLWDESFLWGVMALRALTTAGLPFELIRAGDVRAGGLEGRRLLFVPGGWASNKLKALGEDGAQAIRDFVRTGGNYLGFCGGAGLATKDGIGLLPVARKATRERVPSFSGRISLRTGDHPLWEGAPGDIYHAWWPSQFFVDDGSVRVLGTYDRALPDSFSSDLNVGDVEASGAWDELEQRYGINLNPGRLSGEPAVVEGAFGAGRVVLSLVHFDTPGDAAGAAALRNLWKLLAGVASNPAPASPEERRRTEAGYKELVALSDGLIDLGLRNFLWFQRTPMLLQWRRGVRGLEYCTLSVMMREAASLAAEAGAEPPEALTRLLPEFTRKAKRLLLLERQAMQAGRITFDSCDDPEIKAQRTELFSTTKSHGGLFKELIDAVDADVYSYLNNREKS